MSPPQDVRSLEREVRATLKECLEKALGDGSSDIHVSGNKPLYLRLNGEIIPLAKGQLRQPQIDALLSILLNARQVAQGADQEEKIRGIIREVGSFHFSVSTVLLFGNDIKPARLRICVIQEQEGIAMVIRILPNTIKAIRDLGFLEEHEIPQRITDALKRPSGLFLVTGRTSSGKTTTLAGIINQFNAEQRCAIVTIEDPIEIIYPQYYPSIEGEGAEGTNRWKGLVRQREVGLHTPSFQKGCEDALRMDPDLILVGEIRNLETMRAVLYAADTGHLVFSTLHTNGGVETIERIVSMFPIEEQGQVFLHLANNLIGILSQRLFRKTNQQGRCLAYEYMEVKGAIVANLKQKKLVGLRNAMNAENSVHWNDCLDALVKRQFILPSVAEANKWRDE